MSETANIAAMSEILSGKLFGTFGWKQHGPTNFNFQDDTTLNLSRRTKHPCDVIFGFDSPYVQKPVFLLTDLKSYKRENVAAKGKLQGAITGLSSALRCARNSAIFKTHLPADNGAIDAVLFVYNNDNEYDSDFAELLTNKAPLSVEIPFNAKLHIFGPPQIQFLSDIVNDLEKIHGEDVSTVGAFKFFYPNMVEAIPERNEWSAATPEVLLSQFIVVLYSKKHRTVTGRETLIEEKKYTNIYYRGRGVSPEEFCFLFDYCFRYRLIEDYQKIKIKLPYTSPDVGSHFAKAQEMFSEHFYKQDGGFEKLKQIELVAIPSATFTFHDNLIGMEKRKDFKNAS